MDTDNSVGVDYGSVGGAGSGGKRGKKIFETIVIA